MQGCSKVLQGYDMQALKGIRCEKLLKRISKSEFVLMYQAISCMSVKVSERSALCCEMSKQQNQSQQSGSFCFVSNFGSDKWSHLAKCCQGTQHAWRNLGHHLPDHVLRSWGGLWKSTPPCHSDHFPEDLLRMVIYFFNRCPASQDDSFDATFDQLESPYDFMFTSCHFISSMATNKEPCWGADTCLAKSFWIILCNSCRVWDHKPAAKSTSMVLQ